MTISSAPAPKLLENVKSEEDDTPPPTKPYLIPICLAFCSLISMILAWTYTWYFSLSSSFRVILRGSITSGFPIRMIAFISFEYEILGLFDISLYFLFAIT